MKALSLKQPWATLIAMGEKRIETRSRRFDLAGEYLAIHASGTWRPDQRATMGIEPFRSVLARAGISVATAVHWNLPTKTVIGIAKVLEVVPAAMLKADGELTRQEEAFGDYSPGRWAYRLGPFFRCWNHNLFTRGHQGLFTLPEKFEHEVRLALQGIADLPNDLKDPALVAEMEQRAADAQRRWPAPRDRRSPIDRMIDKAVGR